MNDNELTKVINNSIQQTYILNEIIYLENDPTEYIYLIFEGIIEYTFYANNFSSKS